MINCSKLHLLFLLFYSPLLIAKNIVTLPMDEVDWLYKGNNLKCELKYITEREGKFYFRSEQKQHAYLNIELVSSDKVLTDRELYGYPAPWQDDVPPLLISSVSSQTGKQVIFAQNISDLLRYIERGGWVGYSVGGNTASASHTYLVPTVRIHQPLRDFVNCQKSLPLMSYSQAKDISLQFNIGQKSLSSEQLTTLAALNSYLQADPSVSKILVDGHTDSSGARASNLALSRVRAELVSKQLHHLGVSQSMIEVRAHGSRYPIATNTTTAGKAKNRRVTLRLVRSNETVIPVSTNENNNVAKVQS